MMLLCIFESFLYKWHLCQFTSFTSYIKVVFVVYSWQFIWIANGKYNYPWPNLSTTYLVGSTYLFILPVHDSDQFFPSGVYYLLKGGRWLRSPLQNRKKKLQFVITQTFVLSSIIYVYIQERIKYIFHLHPLLKNKRM